MDLCLDQDSTNAKKKGAIYYEQFGFLEAGALLIFSVHTLKYSFFVMWAYILMN